jgi:hypothetical protein
MSVISEMARIAAIAADPKMIRPRAKTSNTIAQFALDFERTPSACVGTDTEPEWLAPRPPPSPDGLSSLFHRWNELTLS